MDPLKSLVKKKRFLCSFLKYDLLNQAAAETNLYSEEQGRELEELARDNPVVAIERLLELIRLHSTYEAFIQTLERSIEIGHSQQGTIVAAQSHEQLINEIVRSEEKKPKGFKGIKVSNPFKSREKKSKEPESKRHKEKTIPQEARKNAPRQKLEFQESEEFEKDQDDDPLIDASDLLDSTHSEHHPIPEEIVSAIYDPKGICRRIPGTIHGEQMRQGKHSGVYSNNHPTLFVETGTRLQRTPSTTSLNYGMGKADSNIENLQREFQDQKKHISKLTEKVSQLEVVASRVEEQVKKDHDVNGTDRKRLRDSIGNMDSQSWGCVRTPSDTIYEQKKSRDRVSSTSKSDHRQRSLRQRHSFGKYQDLRDRSSSMNISDYKWGSSKIHPRYSRGKNQESYTITVANSMDTGLGSSTPSLTDIQDHVEDDTGRAVRGIPREQQLEDIAALFSRFSNFESIILDQLQSFKKGMERLQESQDELKKSVTAEYDELTKQIEELKVTVTELQESSLTKTSSKNYVSLDMQLDVETTATTSRSEESMETTSTSSEDTNDYTVHITNSDTLAHETKLNQLCWFPFGICTLTVGQEGGLFPLQPQALGSKIDDEGHTIIMMEVAKNSVNTAVCDRLNIRYGVIAYGSFSIPNGYQLGSMVVYVYFEQEHATKPVVLHLPHWVGRDGEKNLKWVIAPHKLEEEKSYPFQLVEGEAFNDRYGAISIDGHCSLFGAVFDEEASYKEGLRYYATGLERHFKKGANLRVMITYASQAWLQILEKYRGTTPDSNYVLFTFEDSTIKGTLSENQGNGWRAWLNANEVVHCKDVEYKSHGIRNAKDMERAVKTAAYPPFISCETTYSKEVRRAGVPTKVVLQIEGVRDKAMPFLCTAYEYRSEIERSRPVGHSDSLSPSPMYQTRTRSKYKLKLKDLMPYINDLQDSGFQIAGYLDLTTNWASIEKTNPDPADCLVALLDTWLNDTEVETCPHTWDYFIHIVRKLRKGKLADKMAKELSKSRHIQVSDAEV